MLGTMSSGSLRFILSLTLVCAQFGVIADGQPIRDSQVASRLEAYLKSFAELGNFTGVVLVAHKGRILFRHAYGMANYELRVANSPSTRFHIASVSKPFTAIAILQFEEQGRLSISDPVARFLPDFPNGDKIKLEHLLTHSSGIPNVNDLPDYDVFARNPHTVEQLVAKFAGLPLDFEPGSDYHYSNSNYNLLALILEKVGGENYGEYVRKHILDPAGMEHSGHDGNALRLIPLAASGYEPAGISSYEKAPYLDWTNKTGNGQQLWHGVAGSDWAGIGRHRFRRTTGKTANVHGSQAPGRNIEFLCRPVSVWAGLLRSEREIYPHCRRWSSAAGTRKFSDAAGSALADGIPGAQFSGPGCVLRE